MILTVDFRILGFRELREKKKSSVGVLVFVFLFVFFSPRGGRLLRTYP